MESLATDFFLWTNFHKVFMESLILWLRVNAGGVPNTCKSNDEASSLLEVD